MPRNSPLTRRSTTPTRAHGLRLQDEAQPVSVREGAPIAIGAPSSTPLGLEKRWQTRRSESLLHDALLNSVQAGNEEDDVQHRETQKNSVLVGNLENVHDFHDEELGMSTFLRRRKP